MDFCTKFKKDLKSDTAKFGAKYDEKRMDAVFALFKDTYMQKTPSTFFQIRYNTKPGKDPVINFRAEVSADKDKLKSSFNPLDIIKASSLKQDAYGPSKAYAKELGYLISSALDSFPSFALALDFDTSEGLVKLWHFGAYSLEELASLPESPKALKAFVKPLEELDMTDCYCTGVDYTKGSMNVYFINNCITSKAVLKALSIFGFEAPPQHVVKESSQASALAVTFTWDKETPSRCCFYVPTMFIDEPEHQKFVMDHVLATTVVEDEPGAFMGFSFGPKMSDHYKKLEQDYCNTYYEFLTDLILKRESLKKK
mmetsp:Transcript_15/g.16  ORF Transcript_15/g.16 Transcript_15/m.16 type:complete len:312 (+) Transcript_15:49-984(+)